MSALQLRDLVKHYRSGIETVRAIDGVSLTIAPGELVGLFGPSGSGKTTLLQLAAGLLAPDHGSIVFDGQDVAHLSASASAAYRRCNVGLVFQSFHLIDGASALDNTAIRLLSNGFNMVEARRLARPWLDRVGLAASAEQSPSRLSMGQRQRVAIARALVSEPRVLLTDEPTGNLDSKRSREILGLLREICDERQIPGLLVTHDPQATAYVGAVHTLRDGRLHQGLDAELVSAQSR
jgi:putative ABC transport system ATP-binding protein